jgi:hypothetical protein
LIDREVAVRITKLLNLDNLHVVADLSGGVVLVYKPGVCNQGGDIERVAKSGHVEHQPQQRQMNHQRSPNQPRNYRPLGVAIYLKIFEKLSHPK